MGHLIFLDNWKNFIIFCNEKKKNAKNIENKSLFTKIIIIFNKQKIETNFMKVKNFGK